MRGLVKLTYTTVRDNFAPFMKQINSDFDGKPSAMKEGVERTKRKKNIPQQGHNIRIQFPRNFMSNLQCYTIPLLLVSSSSSSGSGSSPHPAESFPLL